MKSRQSTNDQVKGAARKVKGKAKQVVGVVTGDRETEAEGKLDEAAGHVQKKVGQAERVLEED